MSISSLYVLSKNTDATSSLKGYEYQILKALEIWLENRLANKDEQIYCDYEEDIYRHDHAAHKAHFKQLKLYSRNFSFLSEEVKKALAHFFMLYVKGEYTFDELEFVFESNADIADKRKGNNAELLKKWHANQENLSDDLLGRIAPIVQDILEKYVADRVASAKAAEKSEMQKAALAFDKLTDDDIAEFVRKIKWSFSDVEPDVALAEVRNKVMLLAQSLPFPGAKENVGMVVWRLHYEIWHRATQTAVEDKVLDNSLLDRLVLQVGSKEDKEYEIIYSSWEHSQLKSFFPGEFYEIVDASEFCRSNKHLIGHDEIWKRLLAFYVQTAGVPSKVKRKAIYELCLLCLRNDLETFQSQGTLDGLEQHIKTYFFGFPFNIDEISDALTLLTMISIAQLSGLVKLYEDEISEWYARLEQNIETLQGTVKNAGDLCTLLEVKGHFKYLTNNFDADLLKDEFEKIIPLLEEADTFSILGFFDRLNVIVEQSIKLGGHNREKTVEVFQELSERVEPFAIKREGNFKMAKRHINLGYTYLQTSDPKFLLKAIEEFHKAKNLYRACESMEGYVLALLNIGQVYMAAEMLFAAKYYVLCGIWRIIQSNRPELDKRLADAMTLLLATDFRAGAWLSVLDDFLPYLNFHLKYTPAQEGPFDSERLHKVLETIAITMASGPVLSPELSVHFGNRTAQLGWVYDETLKANIEKYREALTDIDLRNRTFYTHLVDRPFSDLGKRRAISFYALGIKWTIVFNNDFKTNAAGEQFASILQILLTELASTDFDFQLLIAPVKIHLVLSDQKSSPVQTPSNEEFVWKVYVQEQQTNSSDEIQAMYSRMLGNAAILLYELSLLKREEFFDLFKTFIDTRQVKEKSLVENGYERIYKAINDEEKFDQATRDLIEPPELDIDLPKPNPVLLERKGVSSKYDPVKSLEHISDRYKNSLPHFHLTLDHYKNDYFFHSWIKELREGGLLDWHICVGLMNAIASTKANDLVASRQYKTPQAQGEAFKNLVLKTLSGKEDDNFKLIPLGRLMSAFDLDVYKIGFLGSKGLIDKPTFPNYRAVSNFVENRLNFFNDDIPELSPLNDIGHNLSENDIRDNIEGFGFFIMDGDNQPPIFHFQMTNHLQSLALVDIMRQKFQDAVSLQITLKTPTVVNITIEGKNGEIMKFEDMPLVDDLKAKIKGFDKGDVNYSMLAASFPDTEAGKLLFAAIEKPLSTDSVIVD